MLFETAVIVLLLLHCFSF